MILVTGLTSSTVSIKQISPCQRQRLLYYDLVRESPGPTETTPVHLVLVSSIVMSVLVVVRDGTGLLQQEAFILVVKILQGGES